MTVDYRLQNPDCRPLYIPFSRSGIRGRCFDVRPVAFPARLVAVHAAVGGRQQRLVRIAVVREDRGADADRERQDRGGPRLELERVDRALQFETLALGFVAAAAREDDDELVTRVADA